MIDHNKEENDRMRTASGNVQDDDPLVCFLWTDRKLPMTLYDWEHDFVPAAKIIDGQGRPWNRMYWLNIATGAGEQQVVDEDGKPVPNSTGTAVQRRHVVLPRPITVIPY